MLFMSIAEIYKMSVHERLTAMEKIWDSLCHEDNEPESPAWHQDILKERKNRMDSSEAKYLTVEELRNRYR
jgi:putative addiction module component (TIGR02574 family)